MKSPRFLAALAMAAVLTTGVTTTAHASSVAPGTFKPVTGNTTTGQTPTQQSEVKDTTNTTNGPLTNPLTTSGDISLDGTFTKIINNFPTPDKDGHYLRVTMPIKMDYTYDVDTNTMASTDMVITNNSVFASNTATNATQGKQPDLEYKKISVSLVDFDKNNQGTTTMTPGVKFVENVENEIKNNKNTTDVILPFELKITSQTGSVYDYSIEKIQDQKNHPGDLTKQIKPIEIDENSTLTLKLKKIDGQSIGNKDLIKQNVSKISHNLKLKFEYTGN